MDAITYIQARKNFSSVMNRVCYLHEVNASPVFLRRGTVHTPIITCQAESPVVSLLLSSTILF